MDMKKLDLIQKETHGTFDFPIAYYLFTPDNHLTNSTLHLHKEVEIIRVTTGELSIFLNNVEFRVTKGDSFIIADAVMHQLVSHEATYEAVFFDPSFLMKKNCICSKQIGKMINFRSITPALPNDQWEINTALAKLFREMKEKSTGFELATLSALFYLWSEIFRHDLMEDKKTLFHKKEEIFDKFSNVLAYIEETYMNPISLEDMAVITGFTTKYFCKFFRFMTGHSPIDFVNKYRIEIACEYLINSDYHITDITSLCGFNDISYFIKTFRKYQGCAPRSWQRKWLKNTKTGVTPALAFRNYQSKHE